VEGYANGAVEKYQRLSRAIVGLVVAQALVLIIVVGIIAGAAISENRTLAAQALAQSATNTKLLEEFHTDTQVVVREGVDTLLCWEQRNLSIEVLGLTPADIRKVQIQSRSNLNYCFLQTGYHVNHP